ncbi:WD40 repeat protein [Catenuloplanes nepalensis]|uniref:WD40 repeat protein n=1 Tax=Catenuloplanes nepalensis TaxID=587533 RepID=A0ABT9MUS8_9ACTN|nr:hypothetical protein [Catenuloplanes nepalensis]MDP9794988.1 WD40 repeat protein [Catenuloplanes nepalensis]
MTDLLGRGVRILVIGTATHRGRLLTSVPAASRSAAAVAEAFIGAGGVDPQQVRLVIDPPDAQSMAEEVAAAATAAATVLIVYYVGHGLIDADRELYLAACATDELTPGRASYQALPFRTVGQALASSRATSRIVILDCCFSGRAAMPATLRPAEPGFALSAASGTYLLASAEQLALATRSPARPGRWSAAQPPKDAESGDLPEDRGLTAFTGRFVDLLENGDGRAGPHLTLDLVYRRVAAAARDAGEPIPRRQAGDASGSLRLAVNRAHTAAVTEVPDDPGDGECPYPGLAAFGPEDAGRYFGRDAALTALLHGARDALAASQPVVLVAPSGAGKTSLLNAGLVPALASGGSAATRTDPAGSMDGSAEWPVLSITPGERPLSRLVTHLGNAAVVRHGMRLEDRDVQAALPEPEELVRLAGLACAARAGAQRMVLIVDQLEQLFTLCESAAERGAFLAAVRALAGRHLVVLALRADFYGAAAERAELAEALRGHQVLITAMTAGETRAAIELPAAGAGLRLDDGLTDLILRDLGDDMARLPLLSHVLWATWRYREGHRLTLGGYQRAGGIATAIGTSAERAYASLGEPEATALRRMLPRLVRVGDDGPETARPLPPADLQRGLPDDAARRALERFTADRLLTRDATVVRLGHEALLRSWPRLRDWIDEDREQLRAAQRLAVDARAWQESNRDPALLYRGTRLATAAESAADLDAEEAAFLHASRQGRRRAERRRRAVTAVLAALLVLATGAAITAVVFQREAAAQRDTALAGLLAAEADQLRDTQPALAKQLSVLSYRLDEDTGTGPVLASMATRGLLNAGSRAYDLARSDDGSLLAISTDDGVVLRDARGSEPVARLGDGLVPGPVALRADGRLLAAGVVERHGGVANTTRSTIARARPTLALWDLTDPAEPGQQLLDSGEKSITAVAISSDGRLLAVAGGEGRIRFWDVGTPGTPRELSAVGAHTGMVDSLAFAPSGSLLASSGEDGRARLWDLRDPSAPVRRSEVPVSRRYDSTSSTFMHRVGFGPDTPFLVTVADSSGTQMYPQVWDISDPGRPRVRSDDSELHSRPGTDGRVSMIKAVALSRSAGDDDPYVVGSADYQFCVWRLLGDKLHLASKNHSADIFDLGNPVALEPEAGRPPTVATPSDRGVVLWDVTNAWHSGAAGSLPLLSASLLNHVSFSPRGPKLVADTSADFGTRVWDITRLPETRPVAAFPTSGSNLFEGEGTDGSSSFSPDGAVLAVSRTDGEEAIVDLVATGELTPDTSDEEVQPLATLRDFESGAQGVQFSLDGRLLTVADTGHRDEGPSTLRLFDVSRPSAPRLLAGLPHMIFSVAFSPAGPYLYGFGDNEIYLFDIADPARPRMLGSYPTTADSLLTSGTLTPDGRTLVVGDGGQFVRMFSVLSDGTLGDRIDVPSRSRLDNNGLATSPDGRLLALKGPDVETLGDTVDLYDISDPSTPRLRANLKTGTSVQAIAFSPDGKLLAVRGQDGVDLWRTDPAEVVRDVCATAGDVITREQWATYVPDLPYDPPC